MSSGLVPAHERYASYISERLWKPIGAADAELARDDEGGTTRADCRLRARRGDWMRIADLRAGKKLGSGVDWNDARIPNLIVHGASDLVPAAPQPGAADLATLVPNH